MACRHNAGGTSCLSMAHEFIGDDELMMLCATRLPCRQPSTASRGEFHRPVARCFERLRLAQTYPSRPTRTPTPLLSHVTCCLWWTYPRTTYVNGTFHVRLLLLSALKRGGMLILRGPHYGGSIIHERKRSHPMQAGGCIRQLVFQATGEMYDAGHG